MEEEDCVYCGEELDVVVEAGAPLHEKCYDLAFPLPEATYADGLAV